MASQIDEADGMNILVLSLMLLAVADRPPSTPRHRRQWRYPQIWSKIIKNYQQAQRRFGDF
ncbi:hypothetical protein QUB70_02070 [Microcoleus sp. A003_D6]|uniref:hypothetical protein n=1 Tax=Microcoleus sp. A003_D6 TaxID=3055266 RepID=UPI002FD066F0